MSSYKRVTDEDVARHMAPVLARLMRQVELGIPRETEPRQRPAKERRQAPEREPRKAELTEHQQEFLRSIADKPLLTMTGRGDYLGLSASRRNDLKKDCIGRGLIEEIAVNLGRQTGGICKFLDLTGAGAAAIGVHHQPRPANCSAEHAWLQRHLCRWYSGQGFEARVEWRLGNARADVGVRRDGGVIAIEIAMTAQHEAANAKRDLAAGFSRVYVACCSARVKRAVTDRLTAALTAEEHKRVQVMLLADFSFVKELAGG